MNSLTGKELAAAIRTEVSQNAIQLAAGGRPVRLVVVTATDNEASARYVRTIAKAAESVGIACTVEDLGPAATGPEIAARLAAHNDDPDVAGLMLQTPLPSGLSTAELASGIDPAKDIDGANPTSLGRLVAGLPAFAPATAAAVLALLSHYEVPLLGRHAVVVGRSTVVGKPLAHLLLDQHATVTVCHSRTAHLAAETSRADILIAAAGRPGLITAEHVKLGAMVIDVGTNPTPDGGVVGDVDASAATQARAVSPVPGGVGPVTTALLLRNTVTAAANSSPRSG